MALIMEDHPVALFKKCVKLGFYKDEPHLVLPVVIIVIPENIHMLVAVIKRQAGIVFWKIPDIISTAYGSIGPKRFILFELDVNDPCIPRSFIFGRRVCNDLNGFDLG